MNGRPAAQHTGRPWIALVRLPADTMAFNFFRRPQSEREKAVADRLPPGQYLTEKWPVLHYGGVPKIDLAQWSFTIDGLVKQPVRLTYEQFKELPRQEVRADVHCVTRWS